MQAKQAKQAKQTKHAQQGRRKIFTLRAQRKDKICIVRRQRDEILFCYLKAIKTKQASPTRLLESIVVQKLKKKWRPTRLCKTALFVTTAFTFSASGTIFEKGISATNPGGAPWTSLLMSVRTLNVNVIREKNKTKRTKSSFARRQNL